MNKFNFVRSNSGVIKLPPGFRFQPTDEELVFQYLRRKVFSCQLPPYSSDLIPEINVCNYDPWDLPAGLFNVVNTIFMSFCYYICMSKSDIYGFVTLLCFWSGNNLEQDRYCFSNKEAKYKNGNRANRRTSSGYWKATGSDKKTLSSTMKHIVGTRKTLVFYRGKPPHGSRTDWFMHEYSLVINPEQVIFSIQSSYTCVLL